MVSLAGKLSKRTRKPSIITAMSPEGRKHQHTAERKRLQNHTASVHLWQVIENRNGNNNQRSDHWRYVW